MRSINKREFTAGAIVLLVVLIGGSSLLGESALIYRMLVGLGLGYALTRALFGFAGSANRAYNGGSTKLLRALMLMFFLTSLMTGAVLFAGGAESYGLWINQINLGLIVGGLMFGVGMAFCMCCASGVLTDIPVSPTRGLITIFFFGVGVFLGFPLQATQGWIKNTLMHSDSYESGVFLPDFFKFDGMNGYLGAIILTGAFCLIVAGLGKAYENNRRRNGTYTGVDSEALQEKEEMEALQDNSEVPPLSETSLYRLFAKPWTLKTGAFMIALLFTSLMVVTKGGWGASGPYGYWFGRILILFGVPVEDITAFTQQGADPFTVPFFSNGMNVQNVSIILGSLIAALMMGVFVKQFKEGWKITPKEAVLYIVGGFLMGLGTRFAGGCNVGALYSPIAQFSLSGWIYLIFLFGGGMLGNAIKKRFLGK